MRKLSIKCNFSGQEQKVDFYVGKPKKGNNPIENQSRHLRENSGGIPSESVTEILSKIEDLSSKYGYEFIDMYDYIMHEAYESLEKKKKKKAEKKPTKSAKK